MGIVSKTIVYRNENIGTPDREYFGYDSVNILKKSHSQMRGNGICRDSILKIFPQAGNPRGAFRAPPGPLSEWLFGEEGVQPNSYFFKELSTNQESRGIPVLSRLVESSKIPTQKWHECWRFAGTCPKHECVAVLSCCRLDSLLLHPAGLVCERFEFLGQVLVGPSFTKGGTTWRYYGVCFYIRCWKNKLFQSHFNHS